MQFHTALHFEYPLSNHYLLVILQIKIIDQFKAYDAHIISD